VTRWPGQRDRVGALHDRFALVAVRYA
jgi:hypothetical protein